MKCLRNVVFSSFYLLNSAYIEHEGRRGGERGGGEIGQKVYADRLSPHFPISPSWKRGTETRLSTTEDADYRRYCQDENLVKTRTTEVLLRFLAYWRRRSTLLSLDSLATGTVNNENYTWTSLLGNETNQPGAPDDRKSEEKSCNTVGKRNSEGFPLSPWIKFWLNQALWSDPLPLLVCWPPSSLNFLNCVSHKQRLKIHIT